MSSAARCVQPLAFLVVASAAVYVVTGATTTAGALCLMGVVLGFPLRPWWAAAALPWSVRIGIAPVMGLSCLAAIATAQLWLGMWAPRVWSSLLLLALAISLALGVWADRVWLQGVFRRVLSFPLRIQARQFVRVVWPVAVVVAVGLGAVLVAATRARGADPVSAGLLAVVPLEMATALVSSVVLVIYGVRQRGEAVALFAIGGAIVVAWAALKLPGALALDVPAYSWTYKHLGVVDVIAQTQSLPEGGEIYYSWPAAFAGTAWLSQITGWSALTLAHWFTPVVALVGVGAIVALARVLGLRGRVALVAGYLGLVVSWTGQDYFSPQAVAVPMALAIITLALLGERSRRFWIPALGLFAVLVAMHQLTPFWVTGALLVLAILARAPMLLALAFAAMLAGYTAMHWEFAEIYGAVSTTGVAEATGPATQTSDATSPRALAQLTYRLTAVALWAPALLALVFVGRSSGLRRVETAMIFLVPFVLIGLQNYGGEGILRVYLFSTAGAVVALAPVVVGLLSRRRSEGRLRAVAPLAQTVAVGALGLWVALGAQSYFAAWFPNRVSAAQVEVTQRLLDEVPQEAFFSAIQGLWPHRVSAGYLERSWQRWDFERPLDQLVGPHLERDVTVAEALAEVEAQLDLDTGPTYLLMADQTQAEAQFNGAEAIARLEELAAAINSSARWQAVWQIGDVTVLRYVGDQAQQSPAASWSP